MGGNLNFNIKFNIKILYTFKFLVRYYDDKGNIYCGEWKNGKAHGSGYNIFLHNIYICYQ